MTEEPRKHLKKARNQGKFGATKAAAVPTEQLTMKQRQLKFAAIEYCDKARKEAMMAARFVQLIRTDNGIPLRKKPEQPEKPPEN